MVLNRKIKDAWMSGEIFYLAMLRADDGCVIERSKTPMDISMFKHKIWRYKNHIRICHPEVSGERIDGLVLLDESGVVVGEEYFNTKADLLHPTTCIYEENNFTIYV